MSVDPAVLLESLSSALPDAVLERVENPSPSAQHSLRVNPQALVALCRHLRDKEGFDFLSNVTGIDRPDPQDGHLEVVYHLYSTAKRLGPLVLRCRTADRGPAAAVPSVTPVYRSAEFQEREIFDLFGIDFPGHPDLRRILMWDEFEDYPMRKDYQAPDDYEYEPTPHDAVLEKAARHYPAPPADPAQA